MRHPKDNQTRRARKDRPFNCANSRSSKNGYGEVDDEDDDDDDDG